MTKYNCAPGNNGASSKCFKYEQLKFILRYINMKYNRNYSYDLGYDEILAIIDECISNCNNNYMCWLKSNFLKEMRSYYERMDNKKVHNKETIDIIDNIIKYTFRPIGPKNSLKWLSTTDLNQIGVQYEKLYDECLFLGATPLDFEEIEGHISRINFDELKKDNKYILVQVINLDKHYQSGSHWVGLYVNLRDFKIYFFDSVGNPPHEIIRKFIMKFILYFNSQDKRFAHIVNGNQVRKLIMDRNSDVLKF